MTQFSDTFYLDRAGRYANPLNGNDRLPLVYGDLTDGTNGIWILPCIDTVNFVYAFAGHAVQSVADGNSINIYADGVLVNPANYVFDESNDYESEGIISTIDFSSDQANAIITARGKGKSSGATLTSNIIDIINDFLTVENDFVAADFETTAKATASALFTAQGYAAAGVLSGDHPIWDVLVGMMGSFLGDCFLGGAGKLFLRIDDGSTPQIISGLIRYGNTRLQDAKARLVNLINQCPASYAYNYATEEFRRHTDAAAQADTVSQGIFGTRKPVSPYQFYWCRDTTDVQTMQSIIVGRLAYPLYEVVLEDLSLENVHVDQGDFIQASVDSLYDENEDPLLNQIWRVMAVSPEPSRRLVTFRLLQTDIFVGAGYIADGTHLADGSVKAGGSRDMTLY